MIPRATDKVLGKKILGLCNRRNILKSFYAEERGWEVSFGPLGAHLLRNLLNEWWLSFVTRNEYSVYPVSQLAQRLQKCSSERNYMPDSVCLHQFPAISEMNDFQLPFGILHILYNSQTMLTGNLSGSLANAHSKQGDFSDVNPSDFLNQTHLNLLFFCAPRKSSYFLNYWQRHHYLWWRKFAGEPSKFILGELTQSEANQPTVPLQYTSPWGTWSLGQICNRGDEPLKPLMPAVGEIIPQCHVIDCSFSMDLGLMAYLCDAFQQKERNGTKKELMRFHHKIAPYKVTLVMQFSKNSPESQSLKLVDLAKFIHHELKHVGVSLFVNPRVTFDEPMEDQFERFDEMGIPYVIVLSERTVQRGILGLRNRDTTLQEEVHVTELKSTVLQYLQMIPRTTYGGQDGYLMNTRAEG